jgi:hypothetical protein
LTLARRAVRSLVELQRPDQQRIRAAIDRVLVVELASTSGASSSDEGPRGLIAFATR